MCSNQLGLAILLCFTLKIGRRLNTQFNLGIEGSHITPKVGSRHVGWVFLPLPWVTPSRAKLEMGPQVISFKLVPGNEKTSFPWSPASQ